MGYLSQFIRSWILLLSLAMTFSVQANDSWNQLEVASCTAESTTHSAASYLGGMDSVSECFRRQKYLIVGLMIFADGNVHAQAGTIDFQIKATGQKIRCGYKIDGKKTLSDEAQEVLKEHWSSADNEEVENLVDIDCPVS